MHPVCEIDVSVPRISVHHLVARAAPAARRMRSKVVGPQIGLDLYQPAPQTPAVNLTNQNLPEEVSRHGHRLAVEEAGVQDPARRQWVGGYFKTFASPSLLRPACLRRLST